MTGVNKRYLFLDTETHNAGKQYGMTPQEFFRLGQYAINDGPVVLTESYDEVIAQIRAADFVIAHNAHAFDLSTLFGVDSLEPLHMALNRKVIDTMCLAHLLSPAPDVFTTRAGHTHYDGAKPEKSLVWLGLDNLCHQFGLEGKVGDLAEIAARYNPPKTAKRNLDYGLIPLDDPDFLTYAEQDVLALRELYHHLLTLQAEQQYDSDYLWREQLVWAINAQITRNGILVDKDTAQARVDALAAERDRIMAWLVEEFDFPTTGAQPWKSAAGKQAIIRALASFGITTEDNPAWTRTAKGAPSFSGDTMLAVTKGTEAEKFGEALATLQGQRSLAQLALDSTFEDGRAHPDITALQRSGRFSYTKPGLTIWDNRDKHYFIADPGHVLVELDYSQADARAMAALSGDRAYARRFFDTDEDGKPLDGHNLNGEVLFGKEKYYSRLDGDGKPLLRPAAKAGGHAQNYNIGSAKLANTLNAESEKHGLGLEFTPEDAKELIWAFNRAFPKLKRFKDEAVREGEQYGYVTNSWGRRMPVSPDRSYTQSPALYGQSTTREVMADALIRLVKRGPKWARSLRGVIHDALLVSLPEDTVAEDVQVVVECMETTFVPAGLDGLEMPFPVGVGPLDAKNWRDCVH